MYMQLMNCIGFETNWSKHNSNYHFYILSINQLTYTIKEY